MTDITEDIPINKELDIEKRYSFPEQLVIRKVYETNLVIYTQGCSWLVLSDEELFVFKQFQCGKSIEEVLSNNNEKIVLSVLTQIEAKKFEHPQIRENNIRNIYIYLTNNCNLRCRHCYMYSGDRHIQELSLEDWKKIILDFKISGGYGITFTGGEVVLYQGFQELIQYTHDLGIKVTILSNGILWTEDMIDFFSLYIEEIQISIDGYDRDSYYAVRQFDGFEKAIATIKAFYQRGVRVCMAVTPLYEKMDDFVIGFEKFGKQFLIDYPNVNIKINMELLDGRNVKSENEKNKKYKKSLKRLTEILYPDYYKQNFILNFSNKTLQKNCGFGEISIAANGDIYWCNRIFELNKAANITDISFSELFDKSNYIQTITDVDHSAICSKCDIKYICGGGCRLQYPGINTAEQFSGFWRNTCPEGRKELLYQKMIESNEYFYEQ